ACRAQPRGAARARRAASRAGARAAPRGAARERRHRDPCASLSRLPPGGQANRQGLQWHCTRFTPPRLACGVPVAARGLTEGASMQEAQALVAAFEATLPFALDPFQREAMVALAAGHSVLVAAPTGTGKTVVAEFGVHLAHGRGQRALSTTPIKALSNQKYRDFRERYGDAVGLLTGDLVVEPDAAVQVMTTEVLRNRL